MTFAEVNPEVGCTEGAWAKMKRVVLGIFHVLIFPSTWLCFALIAVLGVLYVMVPALLFDYLPSRVFGYRRGTPELDMALGTLLSVIGGLFIWGKVNRAREKKRLADKVEALRQRNRELQANLIRVIEEKGRNHPKTGYAYRELGKNMEALGQKEEARQVYQKSREILGQTLGAAHPDAHAGLAQSDRIRL